MKTGSGSSPNGGQHPSNALLIESGEQPTTIRALAYTRTLPGHDHPSPREQLNTIRERARLHGLDIVRVYSDHAQDQPASSDGTSFT